MQLKIEVVQRGGWGEEAAGCAAPRAPAGRAGAGSSFARHPTSAPVAFLPGSEELLPSGPQQSTLLLLWKTGSEASCPGSGAVSRTTAKNVMGKRKDEGEVERSQGDGRAGAGPCVAGLALRAEGSPSPALGAIVHRGR